MTVFNTEYIAYVYNQRGYYVNEFASRLDLSNDTVEQFLRGVVDRRDIAISTLINMSNLLGIPLYSMFSSPAALAEPQHAAANAESEAKTAEDAEQLVACVYDNGRRPTLVSEIAKAFEWTTDRTYAAAKEADRRLQPAGLTVATSHGELTIVPSNDHVTAHKALTRRKVYERGLSLAHYRAAYQVLAGHRVTVNKSERQRLRTLGGMVNLGILTDARTPAFTEAAREAFL